MRFIHVVITDVITLLTDVVKSEAVINEVVITDVVFDVVTRVSLSLPRSEGPRWRIIDDRSVSAIAGIGYL